MAEDMSDIVNKISSMLNNNNTAGNNENSDFTSTIKNILDNMNNNTENPPNSTSSNRSSNNMDFDIGTILKLKSIMEKMNSKDDPRSNLLMALKPYLNDNRKEKLDQYVKLLSVSKILEVYNDMVIGGTNKK